MALAGTSRGVLSSTDTRGRVDMGAASGRDLMSYPFKTMDEMAITRFLAEPRHAVVATCRASGIPLLSPVWFLHERGRLCFGIGTDSVKHRCLARDPRVAVCVDAAHPDARSITVYGTATLGEPDAPGDQPLLGRIARRYLANDAEVQLYLAKARAAGPMTLVMVTPQNIVARDYG